MKTEWLAILHELEHPDEMQQTLAAIYLFNYLPVIHLAQCTHRQIEKIAQPVKVQNG